jgi:hypothetical protein
MSTRRILAIAMAVLLVGLPSAAAAAPQSVIGSISGSTDMKTLKPGTYAVRLRDVMSGQVIKTEALGANGQFSFTQLPLGQKYMVELVDTATNKVLATQGPILLSSSTSVTKSGVVLSTVAAKAPAAMWLLAAGAGTAATVSAATSSGSR